MADVSLLFLALVALHLSAYPLRLLQILIANVVSLRRLFKQQIFQVLCIELIAILRRLTSTIRAALVLAPIPYILVVVKDLTSLEIEEVEEGRSGQEID